MTDIITPLMHLQEELQKIVNRVENSSVNDLEGHLRISKRGDHYSFYYYDAQSSDRTISGSGKYIRKENMSRIHSLAQKDYDDEVLSVARKQFHLVQNFLKEYAADELENIFSKLHPVRQNLVKPYILPKDIYSQRWQAKEYVRKPFALGDTSEFYTGKGERVRSKSEIMLANQFKSRDIPYHYEYPLNGVASYPIHPDFTLLNKRTRRIYLWEHLGMMDDEKYASDAVNRIQDYIRSGYIPGKNLILTYETKERPLSTKIIDILIDEFLV